MNRNNGPSAAEIKRAEDLKLALSSLKDKIEANKKFRELLANEITILELELPATRSKLHSRLHILETALDQKKHADQSDELLYEVLEERAEASPVCRHCCGHGKQIREHHPHEPWTADGPFESQPNCIPCLGLGWKKPPLFRDLE